MLHTSKAGRTLTLVLKSLWAVMAANPIFWITAAVIALIFLFKKLVKGQDDWRKKIEETTKAINQGMDETEQYIENLKKFNVIVSKDVTSEEKLNEVRKYGLQNLEGVTAATNRYGEAIVSSSVHVERLVELQERLAKVEAEENLKEQIKTFNDTTKTLQKNIDMYDKYLKFQKGLEDVLVPLEVKLKSPSANQLRNIEKEIKKPFDELKKAAKEAGVDIGAFERYYDAAQKGPEAFGKVVEQVYSDIAKLVKEQHDEVVRGASTWRQLEGTIQNLGRRADVPEKIRDKMIEMGIALSNFLGKTKEAATAKGSVFNVPELLNIVDRLEEMDRSMTKIFESSGQLDLGLFEGISGSMNEIIPTLKSLANVTESTMRNVEGFAANIAQKTRIPVDVVLDILKDLEGKQLETLRKLDDEYSKTVEKLRQSGMLPLEAAAEASKEMAKALFDSSEESRKMSDVDFPNARLEADRLTASILEQKSVLATIDIDKIYREKLSTAHNLVKRITDSISRQYDVEKLVKQEYVERERKLRGISGLTFYYYERVTRLEEELRKGQAQTLSDFTNQWKALQNARISGELDYMRIERQIRELENQGLTNTKQYRDLKLEEQRAHELLINLENEQLRVQQERLKAYREEDAILAEQQKFAMEQMQLNSDLAKQYSDMTDDDRYNLEQRSKFAQEAAKFANQTIQLSQKAAKFDADRAKKAQEIGVGYKSQQDAIRDVVDQYKRDLLGILTKQGEIAAEIARNEEERLEDTLEAYGEIETKITDIKKIADNLGITIKNWDFDSAIKGIEKIKEPTEVTQEAVKSIAEAYKDAENPLVKLVKLTEDAARAQAKWTGGVVEMMAALQAGGVARYSGGFMTAAAGRMVPVRVTAGEGFFSPRDTSRHYSQLAQVNTGYARPLSVAPTGIFRGQAGIDTIRTMVPAGSYIMSLRGMRALESIAAQGMQTGGVADVTTGGIAVDDASEPEEIGVITLRFEDETGTEEVTVYGEKEQMRSIERRLRRDKLTRIQ
jgi:hypothetical protein